MKFDLDMQSFKNDEIFDQWESVRSRVGRRNRFPNLKRRQAAKRSWKVGGQESKRRRALRRYNKGPAAKRLKRNLTRFNQNSRGRNQVSDSYELLIPFFIMSMSEHISWIIGQSLREDNLDLYEEVYEIQDVMALIIDCPDIVEDLIGEMEEED